MSRYLVFDSAEQAQAAADAIDARGRELFAMAGRTIADDGTLIGRSAASGADDPGAQRTTTWDVPAQRLDGKWIVAHPETLPQADLVLEGMQVTVLEYVMQDIAPDVTIETYQTSWSGEI